MGTPPPATDATIRCRGLTKRYGDVVAVDRLDLDVYASEVFVYAGEVFGLLGPNGAGKTTTILMLLGLTEPTAGSVRVLGLDPTRAPLAVKRRVGYLPDRVGFSERRTAPENLAYTARLNRLHPDFAEQRVARVIEEVGLAEHADQPVGEFSRGRQRLGIADALVKDPEVLILLDEPTVAIDPEGVAEILALIHRLATEQVMTVLLSSHLLHQVQSVCHRVGVFAGGRLRACGTVPDLAARWASDTMTVEIGLDCPSATAQRLLQSVPGVIAVRAAGGGSGRWVVTAPGDPRPTLTRILADARVTLQSLRRHGDALDEIYTRWFADDEQAAAGAHEEFSHVRR